LNQGEFQELQKEMQKVTETVRKFRRPPVHQGHIWLYLRKPSAAASLGSGDEFSIKMRDMVITKGKCKIDPSKNPKTIDMEITEAAREIEKGKTIPGIYDLDGNTLKWCYDHSGNKGTGRPQEFSAKTDTKHTLVTLKREKTSNPGVSAKSDDNDANTVLDNAIKAIGGEARLHKANAISWKARGKSVNNGNEYPFTNETIVQGLDQIRMEYEDEIDGNRVMGATVLDGDKGWRKNGDNITKLDGDRLANQKRNLYLLVVPITLVPLKGKSFRIEPAGEQKVGDKPAIGLKVTGPDGKDFNLFFDKESGLLVKLEVRLGSQGGEFTQETTFADYKDFDGIKKATKMERRRDGQKILEQEILEFKVLDKVSPEMFAEPK
jgi:uncharacterized protein (TIGR03067 family)